MRGEKQDLTNQQFGDLYVISKAIVDQNKFQRYMWECRCLCGKIKVLRTDTIRIRQHCGCKSQKLQKENKGWTGCGDLSGLRFGIIRYRAKVSNIEFHITKEYIWNLFLKQNKRCAITNVEIVFGFQKTDETTASLDRINSDIGYIEGNVQWVHKRVNVMKNNMAMKEFVRWCELVYMNNKNLLDNVK